MKSAAFGSYGKSRIPSALPADRWCTSINYKRGRAMLKKFLSNCKKPEGKFGKWVVSAMNKGHAPLALWAFEVCPLKDGESVLDVGCGGGGNLVRILE